MRTIMLAIIAFLVPWAGLGYADAPSVSYIFPAGGQRGTTVNFHVGGHYLHDACPFQMLGPGVKASPELVRAPQTLWFEGPVIPLPDSQRKEDYPWAQNGHVSIEADAPLGFRRWRVWTSQGVTESMKFMIGDLPEIIEEEIEGDPIPTHVELPVTINGRMFPREDVDIWSFHASAGTSYTCEVMANRLGSPLDSRVAVFAPDHQLVAENVDGNGVDSFLRFTAERDGVYRVHIHDVNFDGLQHFVYRLTITDNPYIDHLYPLGGRRGTSVEFELSGQAVPGEPVSIALPETDGVLFRHQLVADGKTTNEFAISLSDHPEVLETPGGNQQALVPPVVMNGRIMEPGEIDSWWIELAKGEQVSLAVHAARLGSRLDSMLRVHDDAGQEIASNDDAGNGQSDSSLNFTAPADGRFLITIQDAFNSRGGDQFSYRLVAELTGESVPDFELQLPVDALTLDRGSQVKLKVAAVRKNDFQGAITLNVDGLPEGVSISNDTIGEKKNDTQLTFQAETTAKLQLARLQIRGTAMVGETVVTRQAIKPANSADDVQLDHLLLAVAIPTPFKVTGEFATQYAARGSTYLRHFAIDRGGYEGPITIRMAERQVRHLQGVTGPTVLVPPGENEFDYPIKLPPWMEIGRTSRTAVMAVAHVTDEDGSTHRVSYTSHAQNDQVIVLVDPGQLDLRLDRNSLLASPATKQVVPFHLGRGQGIEGPVEVSVVRPDHMRGFTSEPVLLGPTETDGKISISFAGGPLGPWNMPLTIRAVAQSGGHPYTAEATLDVVQHGERTPARE
ncbi:MAG: PPC domain-containing protein [Pirellulaceae bacterium]